MIEPRSDALVRAATVDDARAVAEIHVRGWQWGYRDQIPREILRDLSVEQREAGGGKPSNSIGITDCGWQTAMAGSWGSRGTRSRSGDARPAGYALSTLFFRAPSAVLMMVLSAWRFISPGRLMANSIVVR